jgi:hypothetical protein
MKEIRYDFAKEYSPYPGGRFIKLGDFSGEEFREKVLVPVFEAGDRIVIDASGVKTSFSPSFLDEAFGEVAKRYTLKKFFETVKVFSTENELLEEKVKHYAEGAAG